MRIRVPFDVRIRVRAGSYFLEDSAREGNAVSDLIPCLGDGPGRGDRSDCRNYFLSGTGEAAGCGKDGRCSPRRHSAYPNRAPDAQIISNATLSTKGMDMAQSLEVVGGVLLA